MAKNKKKNSSYQDMVAAIEEKYEALVAALTGTEEEIAAKKVELEVAEKAELDALAEQVKVVFVIPQFQFEGVVYKAADVEAAALEGDAAALKLIETLIEIKSGVLTVTK